MALSPIQQLKFNTLQRRYGDMSSDEALELCVQAEQFAKDCGPYDIAFETFYQQKQDFILYADFLDKLGK